MMTSLEQLDLSDEEREAAIAMIEEAAYYKWLGCGCPDGCGCEFWSAAEQEWIAYQYVPHRYCVPLESPLPDSCPHFRQSA